MSQPKMLSLKYDLVPCWYEIGFEDVSLIVRVHQDFLGTFSDLQFDSDIEEIKKEFGFSQFQGNFNADYFGFDQAFKFAGKKDAFIEFCVNIPALEHFHMKMCEYCQGNKVDMLNGGDCCVCNAMGFVRRIKVCSSCDGKKVDRWNDDCRHCQGRGIEFESFFEWKGLKAIAATFMIFFRTMYWGIQEDKLTSCKFHQLLHVDSYLKKKSAPLVGEYGLLLADWLFSKKGKNIPEVEGAMTKVWERINGKFDEYNKMQTWAKVSTGGWFSLNCPGDRTGLVSGINFPSRRGQGYDFYDHNLDTCAQQITLLAGLGALCDMARREMNG